MANKDCILDKRIKGNRVLGLNSPKDLENRQKSDRVNLVKHEVQDVNYEPETSASQVPFKEFTETKSDELFNNVPELKETFVIESKIGEGTFSNVYLAHLVDYPDEMFALKHIIPTSSPDRVEREVRCLQEMGGENNVIGYKGTIRHYDHNVIILPYFPHDRFQDYLHNMSVSDIRAYMKNLLTALKHIHSFSIIHRDIKPGNFLHSRKSGRYNLVDFGLAMHEPDSENAWDIEKNHGKHHSKSANGKNSRQLSPESSKNGQVAKKARTSPKVNVAVTSHKLSRQPNAATKSTAKEPAKQSAQGNGNKLSSTSSRHVTRNVKFVSPNEQQKKVKRESLLPSSKLTGGLCQTKHKSFEICSLCVKRTPQSAPRAGTSGFRAPEVLLKYPQQTTAVDVWSAGIVMMCLLSGKYPFFRCADDMTALAQLTTVFGKQRVMDSTKHLGKYMVTNSTSPGFELKELCQKLRFAKRKENDETKCCTTCSKLVAKSERERTSPAANSRRAGSRATIKSTSNEENIELSLTAKVNDQVTTIGCKDSISTKNSEISESKAKSSSQVTAVERNSIDSRTEILKSSKTKQPEKISRNDHSRTTSVGVKISKSTHPHLSSVSDVKSHTLKEKTKVRFLSEGNRPLSENFEGCSRDKSGSGASREHLDGSRCTCDCGSCPEFIPSSAYHLLERCLDLNPATRITASEALNHSFLSDSKCLVLTPQPER